MNVHRSLPRRCNMPNTILRPMRLVWGAFLYHEERCAWWHGELLLLAMNGRDSS